MTERHTDVEPEPATSRPPRPSTFSSLRIPNYRLFFTGQVISVSGTWMETVAQSFLILQLTGSGSVLGLSIGIRFGPLLLFGPWGGLMADRFDKRRIMYVTQTLSALISLTFGLLISTHTITIGLIYLLSGALGFVNLFDNPARQSMISELVPPHELANAVTLNSTTINMARVLGGSIGGAVASILGIVTCFYLNAGSFIAVLVTLAMMRNFRSEAPARLERGRGQVREGFAYVGRTPELLIPMTMIAVVGALAWEFQVSLPLIAKDTFHQGAGTYGAMTAAMGIGAVVGGLVTASRPVASAVSLSIAAGGWGVALVAAGLAPTLPIEYAVLLAVGYGSIAFNARAKTTLQLASKPAMRGRVMALWAIAWQGSTPIGGPIIGWIGEHLGARWGLLIGGIATLAVGLLAYPVLRRIDSADRTHP